MSEQNNNGDSPTTRPARYVRFSEKEYAQILEDERRADKSAQELLKQAYFGKGPLVVLMNDDEKDRLIAQIRRIGNNVNQIAKKINSGFSEGFNPEISEVRAMITALSGWFSAKYGPYRRRES